MRPTIDYWPYISILRRRPTLRQYVHRELWLKLKQLATWLRRKLSTPLPPFATRLKRPLLVQWPRRRGAAVRLIFGENFTGYQSASMWSLRSVSQLTKWSTEVYIDSLLHQPCSSPSNFCKNSFYASIPALWNQSPPSTRNTLSAFGAYFKTLLFSHAYTP